MNDKNTGGPAFPQTDRVVGALSIANSQGMTLRDYFAAKALPAIFKDTCECARVEGWSVDWRDEVASEAYAIADAMLKAREA